MRKYTLADLPPVPRGTGNRRQLAEYARSTGLTSASERTYERLPLALQSDQSARRGTIGGALFCICSTVSIVSPLRRYQRPRARQPTDSASTVSRGG